jgi:hypothetical protein
MKHRQSGEEKRSWRRISKINENWRSKKAKAEETAKKIEENIEIHL